MPNGERILRQCDAPSGPKGGRCPNLATHLVVISGFLRTWVKPRCDAHRLSERFVLPLDFPLEKRGRVVVRRGTPGDA